MTETAKDKDGLNRSRRERLNKAAKQGYGPWADALPQRPRPPPQPEPIMVSEYVPRIIAAPRGERLAAVVRPLDDEEADVSAFLSAKPPGAKKRPVVEAPKTLPLAPKVAVEVKAPTKMELKISSGTNERALAANFGARPKAGARVADESIRQRQLEEKATEEFEQMQKQAKRSLAPEEPPDDDATQHASDAEGPDNETEEERRRREEKKEQKRKREEWRKQWKEDKKRREEQDRRKKSSRKEGRSKSRSRSRSRSSPSASGAVAATEAATEDDTIQNAQHRANMWGLLNNNGVTTARDIQRKYVGQITDADLDRRIKEAEAASRAQNLMSEEKVLEKLRQGALNKAGKDRGHKEGTDKTHHSKR